MRQSDTEVKTHFQPFSLALNLKLHFIAGTSKSYTYAT